jgi:hypothetical protein
MWRGVSSEQQFLDTWTFNLWNNQLHILGHSAVISMMVNLIRTPLHAPAFSTDHCPAKERPGARECMTFCMCVISALWSKCKDFRRPFGGLRDGLSTHTHDTMKGVCQHNVKSASFSHPLWNNQHLLIECVHSKVVPGVWRAPYFDGMQRPPSRFPTSSRYVEMFELQPELHGNDKLSALINRIRGN